MKNKLATVIRQRYESAINQACEECSREIESARQIWLNAKKQAHIKRNQAFVKAKHEKVRQETNA